MKLDIKNLREFLINYRNSRYKRHLKEIMPAIEHALSDENEYHPKHLARATKI